MPYCSPSPGPQQYDVSNATQNYTIKFQSIYSKVACTSIYSSSLSMCLNTTVCPLYPATIGTPAWSLAPYWGSTAGTGMATPAYLATQLSTNGTVVVSSTTNQFSQIVYQFPSNYFAAGGNASQPISAGDFLYIIDSGVDLHLCNIKKQ
jgi:hypothetical protein